MVPFLEGLGCLLIENGLLHLGTHLKQEENVPCRNLKSSLLLGCAFNNGIA